MRLEVTDTRSHAKIHKDWNKGVTFIKGQRSQFALFSFLMARCLLQNPTTTRKRLKTVNKIFWHTQKIEITFKAVYFFTQKPEKSKVFILNSKVPNEMKVI